MRKVYNPGDLIQISHVYNDASFMIRPKDVVCLVLKRHKYDSLRNEQRGYPLSAYFNDSEPIQQNKYDVLMYGKVISMPLISNESESIGDVRIKMDVLGKI